MLCNLGPVRELLFTNAPVVCLRLNYIVSYLNQIVFLVQFSREAALLLN